MAGLPAGSAPSHILPHAGMGPRREDAVFFGFDIFVIVIVVLAVLTLFAGVKTVPQGYNWTVERFGKYTSTLRPGPQSHRAVFRSHRPQDEHDGAGDRHPAAGCHHQGQRDRHGRRARVLPGDRRRQGELRNRLSGSGDRQAHHDQHPLRDGRHGPRPDAVAPRRASTRSSCAWSMRRCRPGASRSTASRSRTSCRRRTSCSRWAARCRPSARSAP